MTILSTERVTDIDGPDNRILALATATAEGFRSLSLPADGGSADVEGAFCWQSATHVPVFNCAAMFSATLFNHRTLSAIDAHFGARGGPYCLVAYDELVPGASDMLANLGYFEYDSSPAMWLDGPVQFRQADPSPLRISQCATPDDLREFRSLLHDVFLIPLSELELVLGDSALQVPHVRHYLGWIGSRAVATTSLVLSGPAAGVWNVGTLPDFRRRGIGSDMMRHATFEAEVAGYGSSMLLASTQGLPLYERLGYTTLGTARMFMPIRSARF